jgi:UDP-glucose 4-epimerase
VIELVGAAFGQEDLQVIESERRAGDSGFLSADISLSNMTFGFRESLDLADSMQSLFRK